jgi:hypothetical protein
MPVMKRKRFLPRLRPVCVVRIEAGTRGRERLEIEVRDFFSGHFAGALLLTIRVAPPVTATNGLALVPKDFVQ